MHEKDVETLAVWLHGTAHAAGQADLVRDLIRTAAVHSIEMYGLPTDGADGDPDDVPTVVGRFAAAWDECDHHARDHDGAAPPNRPVPHRRAPRAPPARRARLTAGGTSSAPKRAASTSSCPATNSGPQTRSSTNWFGSSRRPPAAG